MFKIPASAAAILMLCSAPVSAVTIAPIRDAVLTTYAPSVNSGSRLPTASALALGALPTSNFDITVNFAGGLSASQRGVFQYAESFWESVILGYDTYFNVAGPVITASGVQIDGAGNVLGRAGPQTGYFLSSDLYVASGIMEFDTADLNAMEANGSLTAVILHEMAHVLGFGTLWNYPGYYDGNYVNGSGQYVGAGGLAGYRADCDATAAYVPVELGGGAGTRNSHWDENWACGSHELMTGYLNMPVFTSLATLGVFEDLGYQTLLTAQVPDSVPLPGGLVLSMGGFGLLGAARLMRRI